jgi:tetratricopeptide (TPR) repeat protein
MPCGDDESGRPSLMADHPAAKGIAALRAGDARAALAFFDQLVALEPTGVPGHFLRAEALDRLGELDAVRTLLAELIGRFPFAEGACRERLALLAIRRGERDAALAELERALAAGWNNADVITAEPAFAPFAMDPAFASLLDRARASAASRE